MVVLPSFSAPFRGKAISFLSSCLWHLGLSCRPNVGAFAKREPELGQQTAHMSWMVSDPKFSPNHYSHPLTRPHLCSKPVCLSSLSHKLGQFRSLIFTQTWRCARRRLVSEGLHALFCLARLIHWLTAPSVTPRASAISVCFQPCSFNSKARKRLPSGQSLAWLDNVFSIVEYSIPLSLHLYAEISK